LTDVKANDSSPRWSPDSRTLYFLSTRSGSSQVWRLALTGGDAQRVTDYPLEVGALKVSPHADLLALSMEVFPDCPTLACTRERLEPWSTNFDLFQTPVDGSAPPVNLTSGNPAWDALPLFLANGDLAWLAQQRPGFESDRFHIVLKDARSGAVRSLTGGWDRTVHRLGVTPDGKALLASVDELGQAPLYRIDPKSGAPARLVAGGAVEAFRA